MHWIVIALLAPLFYAIANLLDSFLANRRLPDLWVLIFYASMFNLLFLPIVLFLDPYQTPTMFQLGLVVGLGVANVLYLFPYYRSLQKADTSVVVSLFALGRIMIPVLAYLVVGEHLTPFQYAGFGIVTIASAALTFEPRQFRFNPALLYMFIASLIIAVEGVLYKAVFESGLNWGTAFAGQSVVSFALVGSLFVIPSFRRAVVLQWNIFKKSLSLFFAEEGSTFLATAAATFTISLVPLTFEKTVEAFIPIFVLLLSLVLVRRYPSMLKESLDPRSVVKKGAFFLVMLFGVGLMVW